MIKKAPYEELEKRVADLENQVDQYKSQAIKYRTLFAAFPHGITVSDEKGAILETNASAETLLGISKEEHEKRILDGEEWRIVRPDGTPMPPEEWASVIALKENRVVANSEIGIVKSNGETTWLNVTAAPLPIEGHGVVVTYGDISEKRQMEEVLRESEDRFRQFFESAGVCCYLVTPEGAILEANQAAYDTLGYSREELIGKPLTFLYAEESVEQAKAIFQDWKATGRIRNAELAIRSKAGDKRWMLLNADAVRDAKGQIIHSTSVQVDITERKQAEEALTRSESLQRKMVANIGDVIVIVDRNGVNRFKSANVEKLFGWKPGELVGLCTFDNIHPEDLEFTQKFFRKILEEPDAVGAMECRYRHKDGSYRWIELTGTNLLHDPDIQGVLGNFHDITGRKQAERELRESEARFKALHNASFGGIAIHDQGLILDCNKGLSDMTGYSMDELIDMDGLLLIAEASRNEVMNNIAAGYEKPYEVKGVRKNGEEYPLRLEARNIPYKRKSIRAVEFRDITKSKLVEQEREKLQAQLIQAQKMESVGRLAGGVAHDFNNMLSVILGHAEMALETLPPDDAVHDDLTEIQNAARHSAEITRQLLAFARKQTIAPKVLDLNRTVEGMLKMLRRLIGEDIDLAWRPGENLWPIKMDPTQIDQILVNLCVNARDSIATMGKVTIETDKASFDEAYCGEHAGAVPGEYVLLVISDDGCGMDKQTQDNLFEPFFTTKEVGKGTGLGLATIYGIVKQNGGFVNVYSELNQGSTFRIYLPRYEIPTHASLKDKGLQAPAIPGTETIMLVEDEPAILHMSRMMLERLGYTVLAASTTREAIRLAEEDASPIHLLMTDVVMPEMNGRDLAKQLVEFNPNLKCLFMSGYTADVIARRGILDEGVHFIQKPFTKHNLAIKIRDVLDATE
ncbi:MAG: PAS domain S-box protein [Desulfatibacillum sp.]|nr:PAS domain S-box protein [Desulfatibacillum sp.]